MGALQPKDSNVIGIWVCQVLIGPSEIRLNRINK